MLQKKLILNLNKKFNFLENFLYLFFIITSAIVFTFYSGYRGIFPLDSFLIYDAGYKIINGFHPFKDYWTITGPLLDYLQSLFFQLFGISWFSYVLHASFINLFLSLFIYFFLLELKVKKIFSFIYAISISILGYPSAGTPFMDHHAVIFSLISVALLILAIKKEKWFYWFFVSIFLFFSFFSKQIPSVYLIFLYVFVVSIFCYLNNFYNFKKILFLFAGGFFSLFIFFLMLKLNSIPFENIWLQYVMYPMEIGNSRYSSVDFNFKNIVSQFKFIYFSLLPLIFILFKIINFNTLNLEKKKDILLSIIVILSVAIFIYCQLLTKNQILIFFLIPFVLGYTHYLADKYKVKKFLYYILIVILAISSFKFHERFNIEKKFMDMDKVNLMNTKKAVILDQSLKNLRWITPYYPENPEYELKKLTELKEILLKDTTNKIIMTNYQILPSITNLKNIAPNKWFDVQSVPNINSEYYQLYKNFFINSLKSQNIKTIYLMGYKIKYLRDILKNNCYEIIPVNEIASKIDISKCF